MRIDPLHAGRRATQHRDRARLSQRELEVRPQRRVPPLGGAGIRHAHDHLEAAGSAAQDEDERDQQERRQGQPRRAPARRGAREARTRLRVEPAPEPGE
jgi:hypothetical protein